jgi:hypothetical protein
VLPVPDDWARNTAVGSQNGSSLTTGSDNTAIGYFAMNNGGGAAPSLSVAVGSNALHGIANNASNTAVGYQSGQNIGTGARNTLLGATAGSLLQTGSDNIMLGNAAGDSTATSATSRFIAGSGTSPITDVWIGKGEVHATPAAINYHGCGGSGANIAGGDLNFSGGIGTGTGAGGTLRFKVAAATTSSSTLNTLADAMTIDSTGLVSVLLGSLAIGTLGKGLTVKSGAGAKVGQATLVAGTVTVTNTNITANSRIFLTVSTAGGTQGFLSTTKSAGASFTITSTSATETSVVDWFIVEST